MKKKIISIFALVFLMPFFGGCAQQRTTFSDPNVDMSVRQISASEGDDITKIVDEARSAVVGIYVELPNGYAIGSGVAIKEGGYILTNYHVIEDGTAISLYYADKTIGSGEVLWGDPGLDLAVVKSSKNIPYLSTTSVKDVVIAEDVYALGTPLTLQFKHTVTKGIVSAKDRTLEVDSTAGTSFLQSLIQHDASINPGNSGGALINSKGEVIGINTLKASEGEGIGFAIPIDIGKIIVERISANRNFKEPYLGVFGFDSEIAEIYGQDVPSTGVYVVSTDGPAKNILKKGDVIKVVNGKEINSIFDLRIVLFGLNAGEDIEVSYLRNGQMLKSHLILSKK